MATEESPTSVHQVRIDTSGRIGSQSPMKRFRQMIKELAVSDHFPDNSVSIDVDDMVQFRNRETIATAGTTVSENE